MAASSKTLERFIALPRFRPYVTSLPAKNRYACEAIFEQLLRYRKTIELPEPLPVGQALFAVDCLVHDIPELLRSPRPQYLKHAQEIDKLSMGYALTLEEHRFRLAAMEVLCEEPVREARRIAREADRIRFIHDWFLCHSDYRDEDNPAEHTAYGPLVERRCVCEGFSHAVKYLCDRTGLHALVVDGYGDDRAKRGPKNLFAGNHSWNCVQVDGAWYHLDVSHDVCLTKEVGRYDYFLKSDREISRNHTFNASSPLPRCPGSYGLYRRMGRYARTKDELRAVFERGLRLGVPFAVELGGAYAEAKALADESGDVALEVGRRMGLCKANRLKAVYSFNNSSRVCQVTIFPGR